MPEQSGYLYFPGCSLSATGVAYDESLMDAVPAAGHHARRTGGLELLRRHLLHVRSTRARRFCCRPGTCRIAAPDGRATSWWRRAAPATWCCARPRTTSSTTRKSAPKVEAVARSAAGLEPIGRRAGAPPAGDPRTTTSAWRRIKSVAKRKWRGGRIACYYGCQVVRPYDESTSRTIPMRMDELMRAVGAPRSITR